MPLFLVTILIYLISPFTSTIVVYIDEVDYTLYVADTPIKQAVGYMNTTSYDPRGIGAIGMAFIFTTNSTYCFWMKDTDITLRIIWVRGVEVTKSVVATPRDTTPICGVGDKVVELNPKISTPRVIKFGEQRLLH
ncbi:MAG: DUF192 domain-containing protein [Pyrobaculum sp.]